MGDYLASMLPPSSEMKLNKAIFVNQRTDVLIQPTSMSKIRLCLLEVLLNNQSL